MTSAKCSTRTLKLHMDYALWYYDITILPANAQPLCYITPNGGGGQKSKEAF